MEQWPLSSLMSLLPPGLAVGPSLSCGGALGLWWVGLPLEAGSQLPTGRGLHQDSAHHREETVRDKSTILPLFLRLACQAQGSSQQNLAVQTQGQTVQATQTIQTGAELLLGPTTDPPTSVQDPVTGESTETGHETIKDLETNPTASPDIHECDLSEEERERPKMEEDEDIKAAEKNVKSETDFSQPVSGKMFTQMNRGLIMAATAHQHRGEGETETVPSTVWTALDSLSSRVRSPIERKETEPDQTNEQRTGAVEMTEQDQVGEVPGDGVAVEMRGGRTRRHTCETCGKKFFQKSHLDKHRFTHSSTKEFSCDQCDKTYSSKESFTAHQLFHQGKRPFPCPMCPKAYGLKRDLKEHLVLHSGLRPFRCSDCGQGFTRRPSLRVHQLIHCGKRHQTTPSAKLQLQVQCSVCSKILSNSGSLKNHMKIHTGERKHMCDKCGKSFRQKGNLAAHLRTHSGEQPFRCSVCPQSFSQWHERQRHLREHSGTRFLCSVCGKALKDGNTLKRHEALHSDSRTHPCPHCPKGYVSASKLRAHLLSAHSTEKPFTCSCGAAYALRQSLTRHQALHQLCQSGTSSGAEPQCPDPPIRGRPRGETRRRTSEEEGVKLEETEVLMVQEVVETVEVLVEIN